jgi:hypothetical protein
MQILIDEHNSKLKRESSAAINWPVTNQLQQQPKYVNFNKWCDDNGVVRKSVMYPTAFGPSGNLVGLSATRTIGF